MTFFSYHVNGLHHWRGLSGAQPGSIHGTLDTERTQLMIVWSLTCDKTYRLCLSDLGEDAAGGCGYLFLLCGSETEVVEDLRLQGAEGLQQGRDQPGSVRL